MTPTVHQFEERGEATALDLDATIWGPADNAEDADPGAHTAGRRATPRDIDAQRRHELIATAAYFRAEHRQFRDGSPEDDWLQAEAEIDRRLAAGK